ncbi:MAG: hypothetical protein ABIU20_07350, partial [Blastocatellia bacterium]
VCRMTANSDTSPKPTFQQPGLLITQPYDCSQCSSDVVPLHTLGRWITHSTRAVEWVNALWPRSVQVVQAGY